jgi:hypothetical protein
MQITSNENGFCSKAKESKDAAMRPYAEKLTELLKSFCYT